MIKSNFDFFGTLKEWKKIQIHFLFSDVHAWSFNEHPIAIGEPFLIITRCFIVFILGVTRVLLLIYDIILIHQELVFFCEVVRCSFLCGTIQKYYCRTKNPCADVFSTKSRFFNRLKLVKHNNLLIGMNYIDIHWI